jgi:hypothetical protein
LESYVRMFMENQEILQEHYLRYVEGDLGG